MSILLEQFLARWQSPWNPSTATDARVRGPFAMTTRVHRAPRIHLVQEAIVVWRKGRAERLLVATMCGREIVSARSFMSAPDEFQLCDGCVFADFGHSWVYRLLSPTGSPLYIGCTINLWNRITAHMSSPWWPLVASVDFEEYPSHEAALAAEAGEIVAEAPPFNRDLSGIAKRPPQWRKVIRHESRAAARAVTS